MKIREANDTDIPQIVSLLKLSLGESLVPKSEAYWRWKHIDNPFGRSPVLVAEEDGQLIGVRAFMRWDWRHGDKIYRSLRAVDTATHPDHQGKGIFKKLTLQLVEKCKDEGYDFVFNTPNKKSMPGYLKMGWQKQGRFPIRVYLTRPLDILFPSNILNAEKITNNETKLSPESIQFINETISFSFGVTLTHFSPEFLEWRYLKVPGHKYYHHYSKNSDYIVFYRTKVSGRKKELRVCDLLLGEKSETKSFKRFLQSEAKKLGMNMLTLGGFSSAEASAKAGIPHSSFLIPRLKIGPEITYRQLNMIQPPESWTLSTGDIELF